MLFHLGRTSGCGSVELNDPKTVGSSFPPSTTTTTKPTFFCPINLTQIEAKGWRRLSNEIPQSSTLGEKQHPSTPTQARVSMHC